MLNPQVDHVALNRLCDLIQHFWLRRVSATIDQAIVLTAGYSSDAYLARIFVTDYLTL